MKRFLLFLTLFYFSQATISSQSPDTLWTKKYGGSDHEHGQFVQQTNDSGYIITGETKSFGAGFNDVWLVKTNSMGDTLWTKTYGGSEDDNCNCVRQTSDGGYILFAETVSFGSNYWKAWLIKTNSSGDTSWTKIIGDNRHYFIQSGMELLGEGYIFVGYHKASGAGQEDLWIVKTDASGDTIWTKTYGGSEGDLGNSIKQTSDGGYIIAANTKSFGAGDYNFWLIRADSDGDTIWTKIYGGIDSDIVNSVQQTSDNGFILAGSTRSFGNANGNYDIWLIKTNSLGDTLWTKTFGGVENDGAFSVLETVDGGYIVSGYTGSFGSGYNDVWLIKTNGSGDTLWTATYGGIYWDVGKSVDQTNDGGYIIGGDYYATGTNSYDFWLIKIAPDPNDVGPQNLYYIPKSLILKQNYPNPFNPVTKIIYIIPKLNFVKLKVYDVLGNEITTLVNEEKPAGEYNVEFNSHSDEGRNLSSGIYFYQLRAGEFIQTKKMILIK